MNYLIKIGINVNLQNEYGVTALMSASSYSNHTSSIETVKLLLENGADINLKDIYRQTALIHVSSFSNSLSSIETVELLLEKCANPDITNKFGFTAYDLAPTEECKDLIKSYMK